MRKFDAQLASIQGQFVLSINDHPVARSLRGVAIEEVAVTYTIGAASAGRGTRAGDLIVSSAKAAT